MAMVAPLAHLFSNHSSQVLLFISKLFGQNKKCIFLSKHAIEKQNLNAENKYEITTDIPGQRRAPCFRSVEQDLSIGFHSVDT